MTEKLNLRLSRSQLWQLWPELASSISHFFWPEYFNYLIWSNISPKVQKCLETGEIFFLLFLTLSVFKGFCCISCFWTLLDFWTYVHLGPAGSKQGVIFSYNFNFLVHLYTIPSRSSCVRCVFSPGSLLQLGARVGVFAGGRKYQKLGFIKMCHQINIKSLQLTMIHNHLREC